MTSALPPLNAVRAFVAAARHQSFTLAANELHVTHGAISRQIKALEAYLGVSLFERRTRQVSLTVEGLKFYAQSDAALKQIAAAAQSVMGQAPTHVVRINVRPSFAVCWLIPRLPGFVERHPGIEPHVLTTTLAPDRAAEGFDVAIRRGDEGWPSSVQLRPFLHDEACIVAAPALLDAHPVAEPRALASLVLLSSRTRKRDWDDWLQHAQAGPIEPAGHMQFDHTHFVLQAATDGLGFTVAPMSLAARSVASGRLRCLFPERAMPVARYYYGVAHDAAPQARTFIAWLEDEMAGWNAGRR